MKTTSGLCLLLTLSTLCLSCSPPEKGTLSSLGESPEETGLQWLERNEGYLASLADILWAHPELAHHELQTSKLLLEALTEAGFHVQAGVAELPTAFVASHGSSPPVIGIVVLMDALPGLSQEKLVGRRSPVTPGGPGHGCGHNLICAGGLGAALAIQHVLEAHGLSGAVRLFGAPAEEVYHGGVYMVREGVFDGLDALLFWHPSSVTTVISRSGLAMDSVRYVFHGRPSDATDAAPLGRNALTAVENLVHAVQSMEDEWPKHAVVNHVVPSGGQIPSVVPERAEAWYFIHARHRQDVEAITGKVAELARRAGEETSTRLEIQTLSRTRHWLINHGLAALLHENLSRDGEMAYTPEEEQMAQRLRAQFDRDDEEAFSSGVLPLDFTDEPVPISDDTAEASWVVPRGGFLVASFPSGVPSHTWQWTASATSSFAHKGMMRAARTLVRTAVNLLTRPDELKTIRREFSEETRGVPYQSPLAPHQGPFDFLDGAARK
ncbi:MAG: amidohydrolase [Acidobacteriota bacterium]